MADRRETLTVRLLNGIKQRLYIAFLTDVPCHYQREVIITVVRTSGIPTHLCRLFKLLFPTTREHDTPLTGLG
jgi:3-deoxy-D-manno-octulosonic acid (KDO) 8-phosphate synthase